MKKEFNITGTCYPQYHYMMDTSNKIEYALNLIEGGGYFTIHHPRQYGKTTTLYSITKLLQQSDEYFAIDLNFQGIDSKWHQSDTAFGQMFVDEVMYRLKNTAPDLAAFWEAQNTTINSLRDVYRLITKLVRESSKRLVLLIDEVDASSEYARMFIELCPLF